MRATQINVSLGIHGRSNAWLGSPSAVKRHTVVHLVPPTHARLNTEAQASARAKPSLIKVARRPRSASGPCKALATTAAPVPGDAIPTSGSTFFRTVVPTALALMVCNMDRICLSVAMVPLSQELGWGEGLQGIIQSAFLWGYLANQLLGGTLADKYGGKAVMAVGIVFFSLASILLPAVAVTPWTATLGVTLPAVLLARFLVGFGEGVALPSMNNLVATRIPPQSRATALGAVFMGFHTGNLVGLVLSPLILLHFGWRALFYVFGLVGAPLLLMWNAVVPPPPETAEPRSSPGAPPPVVSSSASLGSMLRNRAVWAIIIANIINHWGYFIYLNWMPTYFYKVLGVDLRSSALMSFLPWLVMALGSSASGILSDALIRSGVKPTTVRKAVQSIAFLGPVAPLMALAGGGLTPVQAVAAMTAALGITSVGQFVTNMSDIAPRQAGRLFGLCNTFGSAAGIIGVSAAGFLVESTGSFGMVFKITALLNIIGTLVWTSFATAERQFD